MLCRVGSNHTLLQTVKRGRRETDWLTDFKCSTGTQGPGVASAADYLRCFPSSDYPLPRPPAGTQAHQSIRMPSVYSTTQICSRRRFLCFHFGLAYCIFFRVKAQSKLTSTMFWKSLQKRSMWLAWQHISKSLSLLIPCPVDSWYISVCCGILPSCRRCVKMQSEWEDRGALSLFVHAGRMAGLEPCWNVALLQPSLLP